MGFPRKVDSVSLLRGRLRGTARDRSVSASRSPSVAADDYRSAAVLSIGATIRSEKRLCQSRPPRHDYVLTAKGRELFEVLVVISRWGDRWLAQEGHSPTVFHHHSCDRDTHAAVCAECGEPISAANTTIHVPSTPGVQA
ncbi:winged helix-turn-helix transcriptional regulator [Nocardia sp. NPDC004278]